MVRTLTPPSSRNQCNRPLSDTRYLAVIQVATSYSADRFNSRALHSASLAAVGAAGFLASALLPGDAYLSRYGCLIVAASGSFACIPPLLGLLSSNVFSTAAVGLAIALNIGLGGAPGQIIGVWIYKKSEAERGYPTGHWTNFGLLVMVAAGCSVLRFYYARKNRNMLREARGEAVRLYCY